MNLPNSPMVIICQVSLTTLPLPCLPGKEKEKHKQKKAGSIEIFQNER
jgi:hypothetical protein